MDSPAEPFINYEGGIGRAPTRFVPGVYISAGAPEMAVGVSTLWYWLMLALGSLTTDTDIAASSVTDVDDEALGSTDADGDISETIANTPVNPGQFVLDNNTPVPVAADNGFGKIYPLTLADDEGGAQFLTGAAETTLSGTLAKKPIAPLTFFLEDDNPTVVAEDNGHGKIITSAGGSTEIGTIDYQTGEFTLSGLQVATQYTCDYYEREAATKIGTIDYLTGDVRIVGLSDTSEAHTCDYSYGLYEHIITPDLEEDEMLSFTAEAGKDKYEHQFPGVALNGFTISVEKAIAMLLLDCLGGVDIKATIKDSDDLLVPREGAMAFHNIQFKYADYQGALVDISCDVDSLSMVVANNADAESGVGLNSRYPCKVYQNALDIDIELKLKYDDTSAKEDFWGGATGPTETPTEKACEITLDAGAWGNIVLNIPRMLITSVPHTPSGRSRLEQTVSIKVLYDELGEEMITATANVTTCYDQKYDLS
jgi:hypothetical protein